MAYKLYVNDKLFQVLFKGAVINKGVIVLNGRQYEYDNNDESVDISTVIMMYIDQLIDNTPADKPAWNGESTKYKWNYIDGVFMNSIVTLYKETDNDRYKNFFLKYIDYYIDADGVFQQSNKTSVKYPNSGAYSINELDSVCESKILFDAYQMTGDERYLKAIETTYSTLVNNSNIPIAKNQINFSHKLSYVDQVWLDGLYMYMPFWCRYALLKNNPTVTIGKNTMPMFDIIYEQLKYIRENMKDATSGLYFHAHDTRVKYGGTKCFWSDANTGNSKNIWGRACMWLFVALVDLLEYYPEGEKKEYIKSMCNDLGNSISNYLTPNNVLRQLPILGAVVNENGVNYDNYEEESCTMMAAYAMLKGSRYGYLDSSLKDVGIKLFNGGFNQFVKDANTNGEVTEDTTTLKVGYLCVTAGFPATTATSDAKDGSAKYYLSVATKGYDDAKGTGPMIMAYLQYREKNEPIYTVSFVDSSNKILNHSVKLSGASKIMAPIYLGTGDVEWLNGNEVFDFNSIVNDNITLTARFIAAPTYTITYVTNYGSVATKTVDKGYKLTANEFPTLTQSGYNFGGWYLDSSLTSKANTGYIVNSNIVLYAKWTEQTAFAGDVLQFSANSPAGKYAHLSNNGYITLYAGSASDVWDTTYNGYKLNGATSAAGRYIKVECPNTCTITVTACASSARIIDVNSSSMQAVASSTSKDIPNSKTLTDYKWTVDAGTWYVNLSGSNVRINKIELS